MLTGDIRVNGRLIGTWKAHNLAGNQVQGEDQTYHVRMEYTNGRGYPLVAEFEVVHPYDVNFGAVTLISKIMSLAPQHLRRPLMSEEGYTAEHFARLIG